MKDIKAVMIGVFATISMFLFMGQTSTSQVGRYEIEVLSEPTPLSGLDWHDYSYFIFDTQIGEVINHGTMTKMGEKLLKVKPIGKSMIIKHEDEK